MASVFNIGELRYLNQTTTVSTSFTVADGADWDTTNAIRIGCIGVPDLSGLTDVGLEDTTLKTRLHRRPANILALQATSLGFSVYLEGGPAANSVTNNNGATLMAHTMCKAANIVEAASDNVDAAEATTTTTSIKAVAHEGAVGTAVLLGSREDGEANGEVRIINAISDVNHFETNMATKVAMTTTAIVHSQTVYASPLATDFDYVDMLYIGHDATSPDQFQTLGGVLTFEIAGLAPGELPTLNYTMQGTKWQVVASGDKAADMSSADPGWNAPAAAGCALGGMFLAAAGDEVAYNTHQVANITITPGFTFVPIPDPNGNNGIGGWIKVPSVPTVEFDVLFGDTDAMPGLYDSYVGQTAMQAVFQFGAAIEKCCAIDFQRLFIDAAPTRIEVNGLAGAHVVAHGECAAAPSGTAVEDAAMRVHFM